ncbi:hypothetical protein B566_EDAN006089 [Ephemera danica]|nr:hypothetical protein B566_EDAN006089 [Ephemera danica]
MKEFCRNSPTPGYFALESVEKIFVNVAADDEKISKSSSSGPRDKEKNQGRYKRAVDEPCDDCPQLCESSEDTDAVCTCFHGFRAVPGPVYCRDIDECKEQSGLCQPGGRCINTAGSFVCRCATGFRATPDGHCVDIDECAKSPCSQICTNLPGSYSCSCYRGYTLLPGPGPGVCENLNECELHTDGCSHLCSNTDGSFLDQHIYSTESMLTIRNKVSKENPARCNDRNKGQHKSDEKPDSSPSRTHTAIGVSISSHLCIGHRVDPEAKNEMLYGGGGYKTHHKLT